MDHCVPAFLDFSFVSRSRVPLRHFFRVPLCSRVPVSRSCFAFLCFWSPPIRFVARSCRFNYGTMGEESEIRFCVHICGFGGATHHTRCVCMDGSDGPGQLATAHYPSPPPLSCVCGDGPVWGQTRVSSTIPPFHLSSQYTSLLYHLFTGTRI